MGMNGMKPEGKMSNEKTAENLERIADFARFGMRTTETLQAMASLLGRLRPSEEDKPEQVAEDLVLALSGMVAQLQIIHDLFDNIDIKAGQDEAPVATREQSTHHEPAMV